MRILDSAPTRNGECLDLFLSNLGPYESVRVSNQQPLCTREGKPSDHEALLLTASIKNSDRFTVRYKIVRPKTKKGESQFLEWILNEDWNEVYEAQQANEKASCLVTKKLQGDGQILSVR